MNQVGKGIHSYRLFGVAGFDLIATIVGSYGISKLIKTSFIYTFIILMIIGLLMHLYFKVDTTLTVHFK